MTTTKPKLRGHFHQSAFFFALGICLMLLLKASDGRTMMATMIYSFGLISLFGVSALYHRPNWLPKERMFMRRLDHAAIYVMIAGTGTPICLIALPELVGVKILQLIWGAAILGIFQSLFWVNAPKWLASIFYVSVGCLIIPYLTELRLALSQSDIVFILMGGVVYVSGAIVYAVKRPNPYPLTFGYHEIFHALVIVGAALHFVVIYKLIN